MSSGHTDRPTPTDESAAVEAAFADLRPLLFSIAYRMLSSVAEAEDAVQDAFVRYQQALAEGTEPASPKAYLSAVVTRLCIDRLRSATRRRETYSGQWLPEPVLADDPLDSPAHRAEQADSLSMAFLLLLERLNPVERAVFLLRDVFDFGYDEIAGIVHRSEPNCRQLAVRARRHVQEGRPRFEASAEQGDRLAAQFFAAFEHGDVDALVGMLADDVVVYGDGGGKAPQWTEPIAGSAKVARLLVAVGRGMRRYGLAVELVRVNGQPGAAVRTATGELVNVFALDIVDGVVQTVRSVINPDKLRHLGPVADLEALRDRSRWDG
jgi:RNA polymerase sigma-70 factor (ECF subfamily)